MDSNRSQCTHIHRFKWSRMETHILHFSKTLSLSLSLFPGPCCHRCSICSGRKWTCSISEKMTKTKWRDIGMNCTICYSFLCDIIVGGYLVIGSIHIRTEIKYVNLHFYLALHSILSNVLNHFHYFYDSNKKMFSAE